MDEAPKSDKVEEPSVSARAYDDNDEAEEEGTELGASASQAPGDSDHLDGLSSASDWNASQSRDGYGGKTPADEYGDYEQSEIEEKRKLEVHLTTSRVMAAQERALNYTYTFDYDMFPPGKRKKVRCLRLRNFLGRQSRPVIIILIVLCVLLALGCTYLILCKVFGILCWTKSCGDPPAMGSNGEIRDVDGMRVSDGDHHPLYTTLVYRCNVGYTMAPSDATSTVCQESGSWSNTHAPTCTRDYRKCSGERGTNPPALQAREKYQVGSQMIDVLCDYIANGGGWIVVLKRKDGSVNFFRDLQDYIRGFGTYETEFFIGLEKLSELTRSGIYEMRVDLEDWSGVQRYAQYKTFRVGSGPQFSVTVGGYAGTAGDSMREHNGMPFSARDRDADSSSVTNCAARFRGGWWYRACHHSNLMGEYLRGRHDSYGNGVGWRGWRGYHYSYRRAEMKVRPL